MFRVIYWKDNERYVDNFNWAMLHNAIAFAQDMLDRDNADDAMIEQTP